MTQPETPLDPRGTVNMIPSLHVTPDLASSMPIHNITISGATGDEAWINDATKRLAEWRGELGSVYIQWSLAINGLYVAGERYADPARGPGLFHVSGLRLDADGKPRQERVAEWSPKTASERHLQCVPKITAWALVDLFSLFEDFVFDMFYVYLRHDSDHLLKLQPKTEAAKSQVVAERNERIREARRLRDNANSGSEAAAAWADEFDRLYSEWRRKKGYDGLAKTVVAFFTIAKLQKPAVYKTGPEDWVKPLAYLAGLRNALVHGSRTASAELMTLAGAAGVKLHVDEPIAVDLAVLQAAELNVQQVLTAFNLSMAEAARTRSSKQRR